MKKICKKTNRWQSVYVWLKVFEYVEYISVKEKGLSFDGKIFYNNILGYNFVKQIVILMYFFVDCLRLHACVKVYNKVI